MQGKGLGDYTMEICGEGSVIQRDMTKTRSRCRTWELSVQVKINGKKKLKTRTFHGRVSAANEALEEFKRELSEEGCDQHSPVVEVAHFFHERRVRSMRLAEKTLENDRYKINVIDMHFDCAICDVTADMVVDVYWRLSQGETPSGRPYKPKSVEDFHKFMVSLFKFAHKRKLIKENPMEDVQAPKVEEVERDAIPSGNVDYLVDYLDYSSDVQRTVALIAVTGMRLSEACNIDWKDVGKWAQVRKSKNGSGRVIPIPEYMQERFEPYRSRGKFCGGVDDASVRRWMTRNGAAFFIPGQSPHDLRHAYCTRLAEAGVHPRVMMELMGHKTIDVCMKVYTHVNQMTKIQAVLMAFPERERAFCTGYVRELSAA